MAFLEERLPVDIKMGATYADDYAVTIPLILIGAASFSFHFITGRRERMTKKKR